jgi:hypothetical protein
MGSGHGASTFLATGFGFGFGFGVELVFALGIIDSLDTG